MFAIESAARALLVTVISLQALALLGDPRDVSLLFTGVGVTGLAASFLIPALVGVLGRRWCYTLGALLLVAAPAALATQTLTGQSTGMLIRVFGTACLGVTTSLYILQYIAKRDLTRAEPRRLQYSALAWAAGPALGVVLYEWLGPAWPYLVSSLAAALLLAFFWALRLQDSPLVTTPHPKPTGPARSIARFLRQPRLRLAWLIAFGRSTWWVFLFIYAPLYMVTSGHSGISGAVLVSAGNALLFLTPVFGRLARCHGVRFVIVTGYLLAGGATVAAALVFDNTIAGALSLLAASLGAVALDAVGNIPFLRAVRVSERPQMTTVFRTYVDFAELLPPALFAALLTFFDLRAVFWSEGLLMIGAALVVVRYLPTRLGKEAPIGPVKGYAG